HHTRPIPVPYTTLFRSPMDPRKALGDHRADAELGGRQGRVFPTRALAVVVAGDDEPSTPLVRPLRELLVAVLERELRDRGNVRRSEEHTSELQSPDHLV